MRINMRPVLAIVAAAAATAGACDPPGTPARAMPRLCSDGFERGACGTVRPWSQVLPFDTLNTDHRALRVWAVIDPNNKFVTKVTVLSGDVPATAPGADIRMVMEDEAEPASPDGRFTGDVSTYDTRPMTWAVVLPLRGLTPEVAKTTTVTSPSTGIPEVDAFLSTVGISRTNTITTVTPGDPMRPGARIAYQFKVTFRHAPGEQEVSTFYRERQMVYGPPRASVRFETPQLDTGEDGVDVNVRLSEPAPHELSVRFYSDPDGAVQTLVGGRPVSTLTFAPTESVLPVRVRMTRDRRPGEQFTLFAKASGWVALAADVRR